MITFPDGVYDHSTFRNANDREMWERTFMTTSGERKLLAQAQIMANPMTSNDEIRANMTVPPENAMPTGTVAQPTIDAVLAY